MEEDVLAEELFVQQINLSQLRVVATAVVCLSEIASQHVTSPSIWQQWVHIHREY